MLNPNHQSLMISADLFQAIIYSAFEILGGFELGQLLEKKGYKDVQLSGQDCSGLSTSEVKDLINSINNQYGLLSAQGFYLRIGRVTFQYFRRNNPQLLFDHLIDNRMQLLEDKISNELEKNTKWLQKNLYYQLQVKKQKGNWIVMVHNPEECPPEMNNAIFFFLEGFLQECLEWMDVRHRYMISMFPDAVHNNSFRISIIAQLID